MQFVDAFGNALSRTQIVDELNMPMSPLLQEQRIHNMPAHWGDPAVIYERMERRALQQWEGSLQESVDAQYANL